MVLQLRDFSASDRSYISSLMKLTHVDLKNKRKDYRYSLDSLSIRRSNSEVNRKINYTSNRIHLIDWVINKRFR